MKKIPTKTVTLEKLQLPKLTDLAKTGKHRPVGLHARGHGEREMIEAIRSLSVAELGDWA
jgi:hypothetical protein